jgi:hypothetical protein
MSNKHRLAALALTVATLGGGIFVVLAPPASASGRGGNSGANLLSEVLVAVASQQGLQWSDKGVENGTTEYLTTYVGTDVGSQSVTVQVSGGSGFITALVVGTTAYFDGNAKGLTLLGFSPAAQQSEAGKWISVTEPANASVYEEISGGLTCSSVSTNLGMSAPITELRESKVLGQNVIGLKGTASHTSATQTGTTDTLYVAASGTPLPVELVQANSSSANTFTYSHWGSAPRVSAPRGAVPYQDSWA